MFSSSFMISDIIFKSLSPNSKLHIELIFVYCVRQFVCMCKEKQFLKSGLWKKRVSLFVTFSVLVVTLSFSMTWTMTPTPDTVSWSRTFSGTCEMVSNRCSGSMLGSQKVSHILYICSAQVPLTTGHQSLWGSQ